MNANAVTNPERKRSSIDCQPQVPYYRQLLPIFNLLKANNMNSGDAIDYAQVGSSYVSIYLHISVYISSYKYIYIYIYIHI